MVHIRHLEWTRNGIYHEGTAHDPYIPKDSDTAKYGGQVLSVNFWQFRKKRGVDPGWRQVMVCDPDICTECFKNDPPARLPNGDLGLGPRGGLPFCHSFRGADVRGKRSLAEGKSPQGTWVWIWNQRKLQQYDDQSGSKDYGGVFDRAQVEIASGEIVDCWVCKVQHCDWGQEWYDGWTDEDVLETMEKWFGKVKSDEEDLQVEEAERDLGGDTGNDTAVL